MAPQLRTATDDDSWDLVALIGACWGEYPGCVMDVHGECPDLLAPATTYARAGGWMGVLVDDCTTVVASVAFRPAGWVADLERLYVARRWRRRGLAAGLVAEVERRAAAGGCREVELWSDTRFTAAHQLYARLGYDPTGRSRALGDASATTESHFHKRL